MQSSRGLGRLSSGTLGPATALLGVHGPETQMCPQTPHVGVHGRPWVEPANTLQWMGHRKHSKSREVLTRTHAEWDRQTQTALSVTPHVCETCTAGRASTLLRGIRARGLAATGCRAACPGGHTGCSDGGTTPLKTPRPLSCAL